MKAAIETVENGRAERSEAARPEKKVRARRPAPARIALYNKGREIFAERGFHGTTVDNIVDSAGLAKGAFYHHWSSKELLLCEIMEHIMTVEADLAQEAVSYKGTTLEQLERFLQELFVIVIDHRQEVKIFHGEVAMLEKPEFAEVRRKSEAFHLSLRSIIARGVANGELRDVESVELVTFIISGALSYAYRWWPLQEGLSAEDAGRMISNFLLPGLDSRTKLSDA